MRRASSIGRRLVVCGLVRVFSCMASRVEGCAWTFVVVVCDARVFVYGHNVNLMGDRIVDFLNVFGFSTGIFAGMWVGVEQVFIRKGNHVLFARCCWMQKSMRGGSLVWWVQAFLLLLFVMSNTICILHFDFAKKLDLTFPIGMLGLTMQSVIRFFGGGLGGWKCPRICTAYFHIPLRLCVRGHAANIQGILVCRGGRASDICDDSPRLCSQLMLGSTNHGRCLRRLRARAFSGRPNESKRSCTRPTPSLSLEPAEHSENSMLYSWRADARTMATPIGQRRWRGCFRECVDCHIVRGHYDGKEVREGFESKR